MRTSWWTILSSLLRMLCRSKTLESCKADQQALNTVLEPLPLLQHILRTILMGTLVLPLQQPNMGLLNLHIRTKVRLHKSKGISHHKVMAPHKTVDKWLDWHLRWGLWGLGMRLLRRGGQRKRSIATPTIISSNREGLLRPSTVYHRAT